MEKPNVSEMKVQNALSAQSRFAKNAFEWIQTFAQAIFIVVLLFTFFFRFITVDGLSMTNTLSHGDRLLISSVGYTPERGDIVVIHDNQAERIEGVYDQVTGVYNAERVPALRGPIIKRVIATAGEKVLIDYDNRTITVTETDGDVIVLDEPYVRYADEYGNDLAWPKPSTAIYPKAVGHLVEHTVADGHVFVCGDNRSNSLDSRYLGDIDTRKVLGKAVFRAFPFTKLGLVEHVDYQDGVEE